MVNNKTNSKKKSNSKKKINKKSIRKRKHIGGVDKPSLILSKIKDNWFNGQLSIYLENKTKNKN